MSETVRTARTLLGYVVAVMSIVVGYLIVWPHVGLSMLFSGLLMLVAVAACIKALILHQRTPNPKRVAKLAYAIHDEVRRLAEQGYTKLRPPSMEVHTAYFRIGIRGTAAHIYLVNWDEYHGEASIRKFEIELNGQVARRSSDPIWRCKPLVRELEHVLRALRHPHAPRFEVQRIRREGH